MKYIIQDNYRGNLEVYENLTETMFEIEKSMIQKIPITISYAENFDTMTQPKYKVVSA